MGRIPTAWYCTYSRLSSIRDTLTFGGRKTGFRWQRSQLIEPMSRRSRPDSASSSASARVWWREFFLVEYFSLISSLDSSSPSTGCDADQGLARVSCSVDIAKPTSVCGLRTCDDVIECRCPVTAVVAVVSDYKLLRGGKTIQRDVICGGSRGQREVEAVGSQIFTSINVLQGHQPSLQ